MKKVTRNYPVLEPSSNNQSALSDFSLVSKQTFTRRQTIKLLTTGLFIFTLPALAACKPPESERRMKLIERLLKEKYNREFQVVWTPRDFDHARSPLVYCCEQGKEDLVFMVSMNIPNSVIEWDDFVKRSLGRQVEDLITECFVKQGLEAAPICLVRTIGTDPDISLVDFIAKGDELYGFVNDIVISDAIESPMTSPTLATAFLEIYDYLKTDNSMRIFVVREQDFKTYYDYLKMAPQFNSAGHPEWSVIAGYKVDISEEGTTIVEDDFFRRHGYNLR